MKIAVCLIIKNENLYLEEWLDHYRKLGVDHFFIYDNLSEIPVSYYLSSVGNDDYGDTTVIRWEDTKYKSQSRAYMDCCRNNSHYDYIGFIDSDELYYSKSMDIKKDFEDLRERFGYFNGLGLYWRMYGANPAVDERQPMFKYTQWYPHHLIKSFVNPKVVRDFPDPHKASITSGDYINEAGSKIISPIGQHTSDNIYIKHVWCKSLEEWKQKIARGDANTREINRTMEDFENHTKMCVNGV